MAHGPLVFACYVICVSLKCLPLPLFVEVQALQAYVSMVLYSTIKNSSVPFCSIKRYSAGYSCIYC